MARIIFPNGQQQTDFDSIAKTLAAINVELRAWPTPEQTQTLLAQQSLSDDEKEQLLTALDDRFTYLKETAGYQTRDMIVLHEDIPNIGELLAKFETIHYHADDEVRYIIDGKGYFGFVNQQDEQFLVEVTGGDYINVPAETEHWFTLGDSTRIKAVRYFIDTSGWTPVYTGREMKFNANNVPWANVTA